MKISFEFNNGETSAQIIAAITSLFGASNVPAGVQVARVQEATTGVAPQLAHADNPAVGDEPEGPAANATHDSAGVPWDARIHSKGKTFTDKGVWRKLKGVQDTTVASVMRELAAAGKIMGAAPAAPVAPQVPVVPQAPVAAAPAVPQAPAQLPLPAAPALPAIAPTETPYQRFVGFIAANMHSAANPTGRLTEEYVSGSLVNMGIGAAIQALEHADAARITQVHNAFAQVLGVPGV